jgi:hypothetical protein
MNKIPGFNAGLSLSRPTRSYRMRSSGIPSAISFSMMTPAVMVGGGSLGGGGTGFTGCGTLCVPGFSGEASIYRSNHHYHATGWNPRSRVDVYPAMLPTHGPGSQAPGAAGCEFNCERKCRTKARCMNMSPSMKVKCNNSCSNTCEQLCAKGNVGWGVPIPHECDSDRWASCAGDTLWEMACNAEDGGAACGIAANHMRKEDECNLCFPWSLGL